MGRSLGASALAELERLELLRGGFAAAARIEAASPTAREFVAHLSYLRVEDGLRLEVTRSLEPVSQLPKRPSDARLMNVIETGRDGMQVLFGGHYGLPRKWFMLDRFGVTRVDAFDPSKHKLAPRPRVIRYDDEIRIFWFDEGLVVRGTPQPTALRLAPPGAFTELVFVDGKPHLHVELPQGGWLYPLRVTGPVVGNARTVPAQRDLVANPRACTRAELKGGLRLVSAGSGDTRRPVVIESKNNSETRQTTSAVVEPASDGACVVAWDVGQPTDSTTAVLIASDLTHSYLFRMLGVVGSPGLLEYHTLQCRTEAR